MTPLSALIVDDEPLARTRLSDLLLQIEGVEIAGSLGSGAEAVEEILRKPPDLVLLDVEMPKLDGFDVVEQLARRRQAQAKAAPLIAFVTAYPQFAVDAFDTGALDFLCKPVRLSRLENTIKRARNELSRRQATNRLDHLLHQLEHLREARERTEERAIWVQNRGEMVKVPVPGIEWIRAEAEYARLHVSGRSYLLRSSISALADELADAGFIRIHRSLLVPSDRIQAIRRTRTGTKIALASGEELPVGRKYRAAVAELRTGRQRSGGEV
jgi:DNA-binding LytR/AlgR family response regulator